jgi:hypothetical protein
LIIRRNRFERHFYLLGLYHHLSSYGEDPVKPALWLLAIGIIGTGYWCFFFWLGFDTTIPELIIPSINFTTANTIPSINVSSIVAQGGWKPIERTLINIVSINESPNLADILIRMTSLPVMAAFVIALRRKIERRFRH